MGGGKGGSSDPSGMYMALASAQAAQQAYALGTQQLDWSKQQWNTEFPYMQQIAQGQIDTQKQMSDFSRNQQAFYEQQYQPLETKYNKMAADWASPQNVALQTGQAMANVNESINAQKASSQSQLEGYGVNPGATRFASLGAAMGVQGGAAAAGAGTMTGMATRAQGLGLIGQAVNTGRGFPQAAATLSGTGSQAGAAGTSGITNALQTGSNMMTAPSQWWGVGAQNMNVYANAVNGYNQTQVGFAQANASEMAGWGSLAGGVMGMMTSPFKPWMMGEKGGEVVQFDAGGDISEGFGKGFSEGYGAERAAQMAPVKTMQMARLARVLNPNTAYQEGGDVAGVGPTGVGAMPSRYFAAGPAMQQYGPQPPQPMQPPANNNQPPPPIPPRNGTPGGIITPQMSPSGGQVPDDVDAKLTVGEFVMPLDVVRFKGKEYFYKEIDKARQKEAEANARGDVGGEPTTAMPSRNPAFVSRPNAMPMQAMA